MIIIAGHLTVDPRDRDHYLEVVADVDVWARRAPGCLEFAQTADPLESDRILVYERWDSDEALATFRAADGPELDLPEVLTADVRKYRISAVEEP